MILSFYTLELVVDEADLDETGKEEALKDTSCTPTTRKERVWEEAGDRSNWTWQNRCSVAITLQIRRVAAVPVRIVPTGQERFGRDVLGS